VPGCGQRVSEAAVSMIAWPARAADGVVSPGRWGLSCSSGLEGGGASRVAFCCRLTCGMKRSTHGASHACLVKSSMGALPVRLPLL
jgi:hypothetical protein